MRCITRTLHPARFQGHRARPPYFEGWYFKLVDASQGQRYAIIPGVFLGQAPETSHAFVQVLDGVTGQATYHTYPIEDFQAARDHLEIRIGPNCFTQTHIVLQIASPERTVSGELHFTGVTPWPVTPLSPGIMGPFAWIPWMECYHGVVSLDHAIHGVLTVDGTSIDYAGGRGYIEKDWGRSFPAAWVWMQTNHFQAPGTSLTASIAVIPWLGSTFSGSLIGLWHQRRLYRFATYTGARIEHLAVEGKSVTLVARDRRHQLTIHAQRPQATRTGVLRGPTGLDMGGRVPESLQARVRLRLSTVADDATIFEGTGQHAGLEMVGDLDVLTTPRPPAQRATR